MFIKFNNIIKAIRGQNMRRPVNFAMMILCTFMLLACDGPAQTCYEADDFGQTRTTKVIVDAKNKFTDSGLKVEAGEKISIKVEGAVQLCPTIDTRSATAGENPETPLIRYDISTWQDSGIEISKGESFLIDVEGSYRDVSGVVQTDGRGLYVLIAEEVAPGSPENGKMWYGQVADSPAPSPQRLAQTNDVTDNFFELYNNGSMGVNNGGFAGIAPISGKLYFRYARNADVRGTSSSDHYTPWRGYYKWDEHPCNACRQSTIMAACSGAGPFYGICVAAWQSSCYADNKLEYAPSDSRHRSSDCQEHDNAVINPSSDPTGYWGDSFGDHWVNEGYAANIGPGYVITVSRGCGGTRGKFLQMDIGTATYTSALAIAKDCTASWARDEECKECPDGSQKVTRGGVPGCEDSLTHEPIYEQVPNVTPNGSNSCDTCSLNSSGVAENGSDMLVPEYFRRGLQTRVRGGTYEKETPATGELWFEILDSAREKNDAHPEGAYFQDNAGSYRVTIVSPDHGAPTEVINAIIQPIKKILQGYCVGVSGPETVGKNKLTQTECEALTYQVEEENPETGAKTTVTKNRIWRPGVTQFMYEILVHSKVFVDTVRAMMVLVIIIYAMMFMMGMLKEAHTTVIKQIIKLAIIVQLISPNSWQFFNNYLFSVFIDGMDSLISTIAGGFMNTAAAGQIYNVTSVDNPFAFADETLNKLLSNATWTKMLAIAVTSPIGLLYFFGILAGMYFFIVAIFRAAIVYALSLFVIALLLIISPIFIVLWMFDFTKYYFNKWAMSLINYMFQPVIVLTALSIFNVFVYSALYNILHFSVCWHEVWGIHTTIPLGVTSFDLDLPIIHFFEVVHSPENTVGGAPYDASGAPMGLFTILIFLILANAMLKLVDFMTEMVALMTVAYKGATLNKTASQVSSALNPVKHLQEMASKGSWTRAMLGFDGGLKNKMKGTARKDLGMTEKKISNKSIAI